MLVAASCLVSAAVALASDDPNWELFPNRAVQRELKLSGEQQGQVDKLIEQLKDETTWQISQGNGRDMERYKKHFAEVLDKQGQRFMKLLQPEQQARFWQLDMQARGRERALATGHARQALQLSEKQIAEVDRILDQTNTQVHKLADDSTLDTFTLKERFEQAKQDCLARQLAGLSEGQRQKFDELFGEPFDLELLENASGVKPRALTVVFPSRGHSAYFLLGSEELQKAIGLSPEQGAKIKAILEQSDRDLTAVRLEILKKSDTDFRDLGVDEKRETAKAILAGAEPIRQRAAKQVLEILSREQARKFDDEAMRVFGPRSLEADSIAARLNLTEAQKAAFAKLVAEFDDVTAPFVVVRRRSDLDKKYDTEMKKLDAAISGILTAQQRQMLEATGN
jgi:hypothetical protein